MYMYMNMHMQTQVCMYMCMCMYTHVRPPKSAGIGVLHASLAEAAVSQRIREFYSLNDDPPKQKHVNKQN